MVGRRGREVPGICKSSLHVVVAMPSPDELIPVTPASQSIRPASRTSYPPREVHLRYICWLTSRYAGCEVSARGRMRADAVSSRQTTCRFGRPPKGRRGPVRRVAEGPGGAINAIAEYPQSRLGGAGRAGIRRRRGPSVAVREKADGAHRPSWGTDPVRYTSVDTVSQRTTALQGDTPRDKEETARIAENLQLAGRFRRWWQVLGSNQRRPSRRSPAFAASAVMWFRTGTR